MRPHDRGRSLATALWGARSLAAPRSNTCFRRKDGLTKKCLALGWYVLTRRYLVRFNLSIGDRYGKPEIFNTDQGVQFTCEAFIATLSNQGIRISMDGKGRCLDNIFCERLWRSLKYEEIYLCAYETPAEARARIGQWFAFYNDERPHQSLDYLTPRQFFAANLACAYVDNASALTTSTQAQQPQQKGDSHDQEELILSVIASRAVRVGTDQPGARTFS